MSEISEAWTKVKNQLEHLLAVVDKAQGGPVDLMQFAEGFGALARAYLAALMLQGKTSMRVESVIKALDLKTPKSALERFLGRIE